MGMVIGMVMVMGMVIGDRDEMEKRMCVCNSQCRCNDRHVFNQAIDGSQVFMSRT